jgi:DNA polymerase V
MHIDGNSFYASCERLFRPDLKKSPIAVLSNNDGIVIALNAECKALGFKRGDVFFQVKKQMEKKKVAVFSSNYTLYADMSSRLNLIYSRYAIELEVYSIDESFIYIPYMQWKDLSNLGFFIKDTVKKETGLPVSVGIAPTKTLAKMCNKLAKGRGGVCNWEEIDHDKTLKEYPVGDVWGVGQAKTAYLKNKGIFTAYDLSKYPLDRAIKSLTITGYRTVQELNGVCAINKIEEKPRQLVCVSRSFQKPVFDLEEIKVALAEYAIEAVKRMRDGNLSCKYLTVYLMTNCYSEGDQYYNQMSAELPYLSSYLPEIIGVANELLRRIFREGYGFRKVMICLSGLDFDNNPQLDLFDVEKVDKKANDRLMQAFDYINDKYGRGTIKLGCCEIMNKKQKDESPAWEMRRDYLSPRYTTQLSDIPIAL